MKRLVLIGGGHAHVHVLKSLAEQPLADVAVTLISPYSRQVYSGMLPGWIAGHYDIEQCVIPLPPLAKLANATFCQAAAQRIDFAAQKVIYTESDGRQAAMPFDLLSIDIGPMPSLSGIPGATQHALSVRPIERFIESFAAIKAAGQTAVQASARAGAVRRLRLVFIGAGAAGVELALAMQQTFAGADISITLVSAANTLPGKVGGRLRQILRQRGIVLLVGQSV
ncbi:MAG: FAD-dependent oxidoreductase, partial [Betaproteobacteria bacterium]|nr:FAD-dependent oxidoreductase [Betaproteobacteria bacterium]